MAVERYDLNKQSTISRRSVVLGGAALGAIAAVSQWGNEREVMPVDNVESEPVSTGETAETYEPYDELSHSGYFNHYRDLEKPAFERDAAVAVERVDTVLLLQEHFQLTQIDNTIVRENIESLIVGLSFAESRFDEAALSEAGAKGFLQLMPDVFTEHLKEGEDGEDMVTQIQLAVRLIEQTYRHITSTCETELALICREHFAGNTDLFATCFLTPLMMNAYNAGMGTLAKMITQFAERFPNPESLVGVFDQSEQLTEFDVFIGMSHTAYNESWVTWYKDHSVAYTSRVYAAYEVVRDTYKEQAAANKN